MMNNVIDDTYTLVDLTDTEVNFGDVLIGRINYYVCVGVLFKIKTNPKSYYASCVDGTYEHKFDIGVNHSSKIATIDAYSNVSLNNLKDDFAKKNTITPLFESYRATVVERKLPPEAGIKKLARLINKHVLYCKEKGYDYSENIKFSFNKKVYKFHLTGYKKWTFGWRSDLVIEGVDITTHPDIIAALEGKYTE